MRGRVYRWPGRGGYWRVVRRAEPFVCRPGEGPRRNVLLERVELSSWGMWATAWPRELVVRPFRGLRLRGVAP